MSDQDNPFMQKGKQPDEPETQQTRGKPGRKPNTPNFEQVLSAVERGEYDDDLHELTEAIRTRTEARRERVMMLVHEVFGENAVIEFSKDSDTRSRMGVMPEPEEFSDTAPFPEQKAPEPDTEVAQPPQPGEVASNGEPDLDQTLDTVEQRMVQEAEMQQVPANQLPIEQRSARIGGLAPSDMGE